MGLTATAGHHFRRNKQKLTEWMLYAQKVESTDTPACQ